MSLRRIGAIWICLAAIGVGYGSAAHAQALFPNIYPKVYTVGCSGKVCGSATGTCTSAGPFVDFGSTGQMQFNSSTAGVGSANYNVADGASIVPFPVASFTFAAVNGTGPANPSAACSGTACIPTGCANVTETLPALKKSAKVALCYSHNGAEFSLVGTDLNGGTVTCHGDALTQ